MKGPYTSNARMICRRVRHEFVPNGNLGKQPWRGASWAKFDDDPFRPKRYPSSSTWVASAWTPGFVYIAYRSRYTVLNVFPGEDASRERVGLWDRDVVEAFLNPEPQRANHYYEFEVAPTNQWVDLEIDLGKNPRHNAAWNSGFQHATAIHRLRHLWTCEMKIPVAPLGVRELRAGMAWRGNFFRADGLGDDTQRKFLCWSPVLGSRKPNFHVPKYFGLVVFER